MSPPWPRPAGSPPRPSSVRRCPSGPPCSAKDTTPSPRRRCSPTRPASTARAPGWSTSRPGWTASRPAWCRRAPGDWTFRVEGWSDPYGTWVHDATIKVEAGVDVELMLAEGALLLERAAARTGADAMSKAAARVLKDAVMGLRDIRDTPQARLGGGAVRQGARGPGGAPAARRGDALARLPVDRRPPARPRRLLVRAVPALAGREVRPRGREVGVGDAAHRGPRPAADRGHGVRRRLPDARAPHRRDLPQGPEQLAVRGPGRPGLPVRDRLPRGRARRDRADPGHVRRLRRVRRRGPGPGHGGGARHRAAVLPRPPVGDARTRSGSPRGPTARSRTRRTRRRSTRTSTR